MARRSIFDRLFRSGPSSRADVNPLGERVDVAPPPLVAELRGIDWYETEPLETYDPDPLLPFDFEVNLSIGVAGRRGADLFRIRVCNPAAIAQIVGGAIVMFGYNRIVVERFEYATFRKVIEAYCASCEAQTWTELAHRISRIGHWEFENDERGEPFSPDVRTDALR